MTDTETAPPPPRFANLTVGDPAPWFTAPASVNPHFVFDTAAGRAIVLCFFLSAADPVVRETLAALHHDNGRLDDERACLFGVTIDRRDEGKLPERLPGIRHFFDFDRAVSRRYGAVADEDASEASVRVRRLWIVLDPQMRLVATLPFAGPGDVEQVFAILDGLPPAGRWGETDLPTPVILVPNVFEPELCRELIRRYEAAGGSDSGFMRDVDGKTTLIVDHSAKRRSDHHIEDPPFRQVLAGRIARRLAPMVQRAFQFKATRIERYLVCCYEAATSDHFRAHRDNTTAGTAHRRFAVTINLNAGEYEGGDLRFPEFGPRRWRAPTGGAIVFSCSLLHEVDPVRRGRRFAFLPFLYDEEAAKQREQNNAFLGEGVAPYKA
ncbi:MAG TPA: 2OG-Fe(II) oxygenase [Hyphomicrobiales bacterium]|nr:2OG-Fe(II) oxygenase [Hyphomicrobiales bacterium]